MNPLICTLWLIFCVCILFDLLMVPMEMLQRPYLNAIHIMRTQSQRRVDAIFKYVDELDEYENYSSEKIQPQKKNIISQPHNTTFTPKPKPKKQKIKLKKKKKVYYFKDPKNPDKIYFYTVKP